MSDQRWEQLDHTVICPHPRLGLAEDRVRLPDGTEIDYLVFEGQKDYVTVIPVLDDGRILMVHEHAYPINETLIQFPEGVGNKGENSLVVGTRELLEETGYQANSVTEIGSNLAHHRRTTARNYIVVAKDLVDTGVVNGDLEEQSIESHLYTAEEIDMMVAEGLIIQKNTLAAWAIYQAQLRLS